MTDQEMAPDGPPQGDPPQMEPLPVRFTTQQAMAEIKEALTDALSSAGSSAQAGATQMEQYLASIEPDVEQALADADVMSLGYLRDRSIMRAGRVSLGLIYHNRVMVANTIVSVVRILIKVAIGSVAPVAVPFV